MSMNEKQQQRIKYTKQVLASHGYTPAVLIHAEKNKQLLDVNNATIVKLIEKKFHVSRPTALRTIERAIQEMKGIDSVGQWGGDRAGSGRKTLSEKVQISLGLLRAAPLGDYISRTDVITYLSKQEGLTINHNMYGYGVVSMALRLLKADHINGYPFPDVPDDNPCAKAPYPLTAEERRIRVLAYCYSTQVIVPDDLLAYYEENHVKISRQIYKNPAELERLGLL